MSHCLIIPGPPLTPLGPSFNLINFQKIFRSFLHLDQPDKMPKRDLIEFLEPPHDWQSDRDFGRRSLPIIQLGNITRIWNYIFYLQQQVFQPGQRL